MTFRRALTAGVLSLFAACGGKQDANPTLDQSQPSAIAAAPASASGTVDANSAAPKITAAAPESLSGESNETAPAATEADDLRDQIWQQYARQANERGFDFEDDVVQSGTTELGGEEGESALEHIKRRRDPNRKGLVRTKPDDWLVPAMLESAEDI
jgi:hypothetical protein